MIAPEPEFLTTDNWYDGPLFGWCRLGGVDLVYFIVGDERAFGRRWRHYLLYRITPEEYEALEVGGGNAQPVGPCLGCWVLGAGVRPRIEEDAAVERKEGAE